MASLTQDSYMLHKALLKLLKLHFVLDTCPCFHFVDDVEPEPGILFTMRVAQVDLPDRRGPERWLRGLEILDVPCHFNPFF